MSLSRFDLLRNAVMKALHDGDHLKHDHPEAALYAWNDVQGLIEDYSRPRESALVAMLREIVELYDGLTKQHWAYVPELAEHMMDKARALLTESESRGEKGEWEGKDCEHAQYWLHKGVPFPSGHGVKTCLKCGAKLP